MSAMAEPRLRERVAATVGVIGTVALAYVYVLMPMLVVPAPFTYAYVAAWFVMVGLSVAWWRRHPWRAFAIPFIGLIAGLVTIQLGSTFLGWAP
jgi:hypothetical protein